MPWGMDNSTAELVALTGAIFVAKILVLLGIQVEFVTSDSDSSIIITTKGIYALQHPLHRKLAEAVSHTPTPLLWIKGHVPPLPAPYPEAKYVRGNGLADMASHEAAALSTQGHVTVMPFDIGDVWLPSRSDPPSFTALHTLTWPKAPWTSQNQPTQRDLLSDKHADEHKGPLYPLYTQQWLVSGLWSQESRLPQCCKLLDVGRRHECDCQLKEWHEIIHVTLDQK